jgi:hypothetical protein
LHTADGFRPQGANYRIAPSPDGSLMPPTWMLVSHEREGSQLVQRSGEHADLRFYHRGGAEITVERRPSSSHAAAKTFTDQSLRVLTAQEQSDIVPTMTGGIVWIERQTYFATHTLHSRDVSNGALSGHFFAFVRGGLGQYPEAEFGIVAYHAEGSENAVVVTIASPPPGWNEIAGSAFDFVNRMRIDGIPEMPHIEPGAPATPAAPTEPSTQI